MYTFAKQYILGRVPLFASLPRTEIKNLATRLGSRRVPDGTLLFREGETGGSFYVLLDGEVEVIKALGTADERLLAVRHAGSFLGEMSLFSQDGTHTASVRSRTPLRMLEMSPTEFEGLIQRQPGFMYELLRTLSLRLEESENLTIRDLSEKNRQLTLAYEELKAAQDQIIEKEKLERELEVARDIQSSLLPRSLPRRPGFDFAARILPMSAVGGDFYDFIELDEDMLGIAVGDVMDHGVPAALLMALTVTVLRAEAQGTPSPRKTLRNVNRQLLERDQHGFFATVLYGILDTGSRRFKYVRAGHSLPILLNAQREVVPLEYGRGQPLGLHPDPQMDVHEVILSPGSLMLIYTDGVVEAMDAAGKLFGLDRLVLDLRKLGKTTSGETCDRILHSLNRFRQDAVQTDDITLLAVQVD